MEQDGQQRHPESLFIKNRPNYPARLSYFSRQQAGDLCYSKRGRAFVHHSPPNPGVPLPRKKTFSQLEPIINASVPPPTCNQQQIHACELIVVKQAADAASDNRPVTNSACNVEFTEKCSFHLSVYSSTGWIPISTGTLPSPPHVIVRRTRQSPKSSPQPKRIFLLSVPHQDFLRLFSL